VPIRVVVSQISPPIRVVLLCAVAFLGAYMLFLRPKDEAFVEPTPAPNTQTGEPAVSEPGKVAEAAQDAVDAANSKLEAQESVDGVDAGESAAAGTGTASGTKKGAKGGAAAPGTVPADLKGVPAPVKKAIRQEKVLALLFWNNRSADDKAVRAELRQVDAWDGRAKVHVASIKDISKWGRISRGVNVDQSPTVVVVDSQLRAETMVGFVDSETINQAVADALRNTKGLIDDPYLAKINAVCADHAGPLFAIPSPDVVDGPKLSEVMQRRHRLVSSMRDELKAVPAPKKWRAFKAATLSDVSEHVSRMADWRAYLGEKPTLARMASSLERFAGREGRLVQRINRRFDRHHVVSCGRNM